MMILIEESIIMTFSHRNPDSCPFSMGVFIGPESDHWQCLSLTDSLTDSLTHSLTDSRLVKLIGMNLVCENGNSKLSQLVSLPTLVSNKLTNCCLIDFDRL